MAVLGEVHLPRGVFLFFRFFNFVLQTGKYPKLI